MNTEHNIRLTAAEIGSLWIQYIMDSMAVCTIKYFLAKTEDAEIWTVLTTALSLAEAHVQEIDRFFTQEGFPVPIGFTGQDVDLSAPRLYSDPFHLAYIKSMAKSGMVAYALALSLFSRADVRKFALECLKTAADLDGQATRVLQAKGLYVRPPYIAAQGQAEFIQETDYLGSFFGKQRTLNCLEITHLFFNCQSEAQSKALFAGFSQVARDAAVRDIIMQASEILDKHIAVLATNLKESGIPAPMLLDSDIAASTTAPFSDKLMLLHTAALMNMVLGYYAAGMGASLRADLVADYARLAAEVGKFGLGAIQLLIDKGWAEEPPMSVDRKELALSR
ncbi:MAG: DUF3231 family protein [Negativicutes bacterium]|nr:DUF3231 family protein [Negativicutes bacterium]